MRNLRELFDLEKSKIPERNAKIDREAEAAIVEEIEMLPPSDDTMTPTEEEASQGGGYDKKTGNR